MKKIISLIRACMTSDMNVFKIKSKQNKKSSNLLVAIFISLCLMFSIWSNANMLFEKVAPMHLQSFVIAIAIFSISIFTIIEGIYKTGSLIFNCKDDQLLLSLPIKRRTVLFIRIFKFYVFELIFNSIFLIPFLVAYIRWADKIDYTFYITNVVMLFILPIIPIIISCIVGAIMSSLSSRFKYKNAMQIIVSMTVLLVFMYGMFNLNDVYQYILKHATSLNDFITKLYYPAGVYATLITDFDIGLLIQFIVVNIVIFAISIFILSKFYFKINSRLKSVTTTKKVSVKDINIKQTSKKKSLIMKELNTFFKIPVFIVNAGFALVLFIMIAIAAVFKFDSLIPALTDPNGMNISYDLIMNNTSIIIFMLISITAFMTSITSSVISLEGRCINILKTLPIKTKDILMSKIYSSLVLTTPIIIIGDIILFIKFKTSFVEMVLILILSVLIPLVSHFIGLMINLKYPKLDAENPTEVVKQSMSSFVSVMGGMIFIIITFVVVTNIMGAISSTILLSIITIIYVVIDIILYLLLSTIGVKEFNNLTI